jgi:hypothetical protein
MDHQFFLPTMRTYRHPFENGKQKFSVTYSKSTSTNSHIETSIPIEKDTLTMNFDIIDGELFRIAGSASGVFDVNNMLGIEAGEIAAGRLSDVDVKREYHFIVRPNPLRSSVFKRNYAAW